mgnify:CR=1 FL=1
MYVSAYYHIPKSKMRHMGIARYVRHAPETLRMIRGSQLIFFYEEDFIGELIARLCENFDIDLRREKRPLVSLPARAHAEQISKGAQRIPVMVLKNSDKEKGNSHLAAMDIDGDRTEYMENLTIWLSKIFLTSEVASGYAVRDRPVAWVDIALAKNNFTRQNWDFSKIDRNPPSCLLHYGSAMLYLGRRLPLSAGYLRADRDHWEVIENLFQAQLDTLQYDGYPHDEETVLSHVVGKYPRIFECIGRPYQGRIGKAKYYFNRVFRS